jgi:hypothetical protein
LAQIEDCVQPVILLGWTDEILENELKQNGYEIHSLAKAQWGPNYERMRSTMNHWHQKLRDSCSTAIRERRQNLDRPLGLRLKRRILQTTRSMAVAFPGAIKKIQELESALFWRDTNAPVVAQQLRRLKIDAVLSLTPFLTDEEMAVRVSVLSGVPSAAAVLSFDNLTTRPWIPITFDLYLLWNRHNVDQLRRGYPQTFEREVKIVGSPQFDFYRKPEFLWKDDEWRRRLGLPPNRPVLLFAGGYFTCAPHEPQFLAQIDEAIQAKQIPGNPIILFRRHPVDPLERWQPILKRARNVVVDNPWRLGTKILGHTNIGHEDICKLASTLYYSGVHVNVASTMAVDGAICDRYQVGPAYDDGPSGKYDRTAIECYHQEHFLPITHSGGIDIVRNRADLIRAVCEGFMNPEQRSEGRRRIVEEICTFSDGKCTQRVASAVRDFVESSVPRSAIAMSSSL